MAFGVKTNEGARPGTHAPGERPGTRAQVKFVRMSAYKARQVIDTIRGKDAAEAEAILRFTEREAARVIRKCLNSAVANAANNDGLDPETLYVSACLRRRGHDHQAVQAPGPWPCHPHPQAHLPHHRDRLADPGRRARAPRQARRGPRRQRHPPHPHRRRVPRRPRRPQPGGHRRGDRGARHRRGHRRGRRRPTTDVVDDDRGRRGRHRRGRRGRGRRGRAAADDEDAAADAAGEEEE